MSLQNRIDKLERAAGQNLCLTHDLTLLTDAELRALCDCYTEAGELITERVTSEFEAAMRRIER